MTLIVEDGTGKVDANGYTDAAFVAAYLTNRDSVAAWTAATPDEQAAAIVDASDFIDRKYGQRFLGIQQFTNYGPEPAANSLVATSNFVAADSVTINAIVYTFVAVLAAANDVLLGADRLESLENLADAINADATNSGVTYDAATVANPTFTAEAADSTADPSTFAILAIAARLTGPEQNQLPCLTSNAAVSAWTYPQTQGGANQYDVQALAFPRSALVTRSGQVVVGVPVNLKKATAEYSVRALASPLQPDPTQSANGGAVTRVKQVAGPVESDITYQNGSTLNPPLRSYPMADKLLAAYIGPPGAYR